MNFTTNTKDLIIKFRQILLNISPTKRST